MKNMGLIYTYLFFLLQLCLNVICFKSQYKCGPEQKCICYTDSEILDEINMDCSNRKLYSFGEICDTLGNVTRLNARDNRINDTAQYDVRVEGCSRLRYLSLRNNRITDIDKKVFTSLSDLNTLDVSHNKIAIFSLEHRFMFESLPDLERLVVNGNSVGCSDSNCAYPDLSNLTQLNSLYIDGLWNASFDQTFSGPSNLSSLFLSGFNGTCNIEELSDNFFANLVKLRTLSVALCNIKGIGIHTFTQMPNLEWLDLSQNRQLGMRALFNVSYGLQFTNIKFLNYSYVYETFGLGTEITKFDLCFLRNTSLREIAFDGNRIQLFETNALLLLPPTLTVIHANDNQLTYGDYVLSIVCLFNMTEFYGSFQNAKHSYPRYTYVTDNKRHTNNVYLKTCTFMEDEYLRNVSNHIEDCHFLEQDERVRSTVLQPKNLKKFLMTDSNLKFTRYFIAPFQNKINYADLSGNDFDSWEDTIGSYEYLKYVDFSKNYCSNISNSFFHNFRRLENLQIHSNFIGLVLSNEPQKKVFQHLLNLKTLNLSLNKITYLHPMAFEGLNNLEILDLSSNGLVKWTIDVSAMANLMHMNLSNNAVQSLPVSLMEHFWKVSTNRNVRASVNLLNNPLKYGCSNKDFLLWMINHKSLFQGFQNYTFVDDEDCNQIPSENIEDMVRKLDAKCRSYTVWIVISVIGVSVAFAVIMGGLLYRNRWKLRYFMYMSKQRFHGYVRVPDSDPHENYKYDAFISYAEENIRFVKDHVIPKVETDGISLCIHQRDFLPGNHIADNIINAIKSSRKTIILLTEVFLKRKWCIYEFNMARMENIYSRDRSCLVIVMLQSVATKHMPTEILDWIQKESYLEYSEDEDGEQLFWNKLKDAIRQ